jgi:transposase-like protein
VPPAAAGSGKLLQMPSGRRISNEVIDELLAGASTQEEIAGPGGLLAELTKRLVKRAMEVKITDHLGYEPHQQPSGGAENTRNDPEDADHRAGRGRNRHAA